MNRSLPGRYGRKGALGRENNMHKGQGGMKEQEMLGDGGDVQPP